MLAKYVITTTLICPTCNENSKCKVDDVFHSDKIIFNDASDLLKNHGEGVCNACGAAFTTLLESYEGKFTHSIFPNNQQHKE
jgi:hypothetical protein